MLLVMAMLTLCSAGLYLVKPEEALGADTFSSVFEVTTARQAYYGALLLWLVLSALEATSGGLLLMGRKSGRALGLIWAWGALGGFILVTLVNLLLVLPGLDEAGLSSLELVRTLGVGPLAGCCPVVVSLGVLVVLHHPLLVRWARS